MCATVLLFLLVEGVCSRKSTEPLQFIKSLGRFLITWKIQTLGNSRGRILLGKKDSGGSFQTKIALSFIQKTNLFTYWPLGKTSSWWFHCIALTMVRRYIDGLTLFAMFETQHNCGPSQGNNLISSYQVGPKLFVAYNF